MPSQSYGNSYASASSSSRHHELSSSNYRSSRSERHYDDAYRRPRSPEPSRHGHSEEPDTYRPDRQKYDDGRRSSYNPSHSTRHADERDYYREPASRSRDHRSNYSPPPYDRREYEHDRRHDDYDRHSSSGHRRHPSPDPRGSEVRDSWDAYDSRDDRRRPIDHRDARRSGDPDNKHAHNSRRYSRSPDRHRSSHSDRDAERRRQNGHHDSSHHRDDRDSRRQGRDRSRSRSRDRAGGARTRDEPRSSKASQPRAGSEDGQLVEDVDVPTDGTRLLSRKAHPDTAVASSTHSSRSREQDRRAAQKGWDSLDDDDDRLEKLAAASKASAHVNGTQARSGESARLRESNGAAVHVRPSHTNGYREQPSRAEHRHHDDHKSRKRTPSPPSSRSSALGSGSTSATSIPRSQAAPTRPSTVKATEKKLSFGHVELPHELPAELRGKNWMAAAPYKEGVKTVRETAAEKHIIDAKTEDPRRWKKMRPRDTLHSIRYAWDANSVGNKPLPAPRNLVLTNLSALMKPIDILPHIRFFGRIESSKIEMDPKIGQSLGIFTVSFAHDFDEQGKPLSGTASGQTLQHGGKAAKAAHTALNGKQVGANRVFSFLDRSGEVLAEKVKETLAANEAKLRRPPPTPNPVPPKVSASPMTPSATKPNMPPPHVPRGPRASLAAAASPQANSSSPPVRAGSDRYESSSARWPSSRYAPGAEESRPKERSSLSDPYSRRRDADDYRSPASRSSTSRRDDTSDRRHSSSRTEMDKKRTDKVPTTELIATLARNKSPYIFIPKPRSCNIDTDDISDHLKDTPPRWIREGDTGWYAAYESLREANACKIVNETLSINGYTLQVEVRSAPPQSIPAKTNQRSVSSSSSAAPTTTDGARPIAKTASERKAFDTGLRPLTTEDKQKTEWTATELQDAVFRMLQKELADSFIRDVKSRVVAPHLNAYLKASGEGGQILAKAVIKKPVTSSKAIDRGLSVASAVSEARLPSFRKVASAKPKKASTADDAATPKSKRDSAASKKDREHARRIKDRRAEDFSSSEDEKSSHTKRTDSRTKSKPAAQKRAAAPLLWDSDEEAESDDATPTEPDATSRSVSASVEPAAPGQKEDVKTKKKTKAKAEPKAGKKTAAKKGAVTSVDLDVEMDDGDETATPETDVSAKTSKAKPKQAKAPAKPRPIPDDPFEAGVVEDEEDLYHLRMVLERIKMGEPLTESEWPDEAELEEEAEEAALAAGAPPKYSTGSARTEGMYRIAPEHKALHLPDRNKATEEADSAANAHILQSARNNRADSRRLVLGLEQHKRETATDTDIFKFNQLRTRKKQLKFAKSPIHDWGLYAMEYIPAGDMVIEYVGEVVRQQVADEREKAYERGGNFSTYLFRVDDDLVVDATHKGNIARLMNHCCTPNCNAKILTLNGEKRIVLFAKSPIRAGEELTYDYKFQSSADDEDAIPCLCGSPGCRRFL